MVNVPVNYAINDSDNVISPVRHQTIVKTDAGLLLIGPLGTNVSKIWIKIQVSFRKMNLKMSFAKWRLCSLGLNVAPRRVELLTSWGNHGLQSSSFVFVTLRHPPIGAAAVTSRKAMRNFNLFNTTWYHKKDYEISHQHVKQGERGTGRGRDIDWDREIDWDVLHMPVLAYSL